MTTKQSMHTPGPWHTGEGRASVIIYGSKGEPVANAETYWKFSQHEVATANAQLIAAAPAMLEALQGLVADKYLADPINNQRMHLVRKAIAAATGEVQS